ncbi:MAG: hypothetical protein HYX52_08290 [Chloroflexi bacterium]|nr:hypothetical protein [Chloroflexota bacterium]
MREPASDPGVVDGPSRTGRLARNGFAGPVLLVALGTLLLLNNLGVLPREVWSGLWRLWPLGLVLVGLSLVLGGRIPRLLLGLLLIGIVGVGAAAWATAERSPATAGAGREAAGALDQPLQGAREANVTLRFGAGRLVVDPLDGSRPELVSALQYSGSPDLQPSVSYRTRDGVGDLEYVARGSTGGSMAFPTSFLWPLFGDRGSSASSPSMQVHLSTALPLSVNVQTGVADATLDLSGLQLTRLDLSAGAASTRMSLPRPRGTLPVRVQGGASTFAIEIPADVPARIQIEGGLSTVAVDEGRFPASGGRRQFTSPAYASATDRVDLRLEVGAATVSVR